MQSFVSCQRIISWFQGLRNQNNPTDINIWFKVSVLLLIFYNVVCLSKKLDIILQHWYSGNISFGLHWGRMLFPVSSSWSWIRKCMIGITTCTGVFYLLLMTPMVLQELWSDHWHGRNSLTSTRELIWLHLFLFLYKIHKFVRRFHYELYLLHSFR